MMQGFGVHTYRLVNADGESRFVKFHWKPIAGTHSLVWDEAVKISGADSDFHRRDLWEAIEAGAYPEWELGLQIFTEEQAEASRFDVLDATKIVPEELVPVMPVGRMVLNRNPDNFFAETEQVAFCTAHVVPGHRLLQRSAAGRPDSLLRRHADLASGRAELPRDSDQRAGRAGAQQPARRHAPPGDQSRPGVATSRTRSAAAVRSRRARPASSRSPSRCEPDDHKVRGKAERFADHYTQARCSGTARRRPRSTHIINAFRFELSRVQTPAVRERMVSGLMNVDAELAEAVADGLGMRTHAGADAEGADSSDVTPEVTDVAGAVAVGAPRRWQHPDPPGRHSGRRRLRRRTRSKRSPPICSPQAPCRASSAPRSARSQPADGDAIEVDTTVEATPSVLFDAVVLPGWRRGHRARSRADGRVLEFVKDQYRHCKPILALGAATDPARRRGHSDAARCHRASPTRA